jgi:hypothetical protein
MSHHVNRAIQKKNESKFVDSKATEKKYVKG